MGWTQERASRLYGWFTGLAYLTPIAGGWLADRYLGTRRSLVIGGALLTLGYFALALGHSASLYLGLALVVLGTGFFKPNGYTIVGQLYQPGDPRSDAGFTFYYMAINVGALLGPLVCAWLAADPRYGWSYGFGAAGGAMLCGLIFYLWSRKAWLRGIGLPPWDRRGPAPSPGALAPIERRRILAIAIITVFVVFFWLAFEQVGSSLNVFAAHRTDRVLEGWAGRMLPGGEIPAAWFQSINTFHSGARAGCGRSLATPGAASPKHSGQDGAGPHAARRGLSGNGDWRRSGRGWKPGEPVVSGGVLSDFQLRRAVLPAGGHLVREPGGPRPFRL